MIWIDLGSRRTKIGHYGTTPVIFLSRWKRGGRISTIGEREKDGKSEAKMDGR